MISLSNEEKIYGLSLIWKEAEYNFAFWDKHGMPDWDEAYRNALPKVLAAESTHEYYLELMQFISLLKDGHTRVWYPKELQLQMGYLPITMSYINGNHIITNYKEFLQNDIEPFSLVLKINGYDIDKYLENNIYPYCWHEKIDSAFWQINNLISMGDVGSFIDVELLSPNGIYKTLKIQRIPCDEFNGQKWCVNSKLNSNVQTEELFRSESHYILRTSDNIVILGIKSFMINSLPAEYYKNLHLLKDAEGILIDIRDNSGGNSGNADAVAQSFIDGSFINHCDKRMVHIGAFKAWGKGKNFGGKTYDEVVAERGYSKWLEKIYKIPRRIYYETDKDTYHNPECPVLLKQPVVVLTNCQTASAAEDFLVSLDYAKRITIVGTPSFGSTGNPITLELPGGGGAGICTRQCTYPDGKEFINIGVQPHIYADLAVSDYINNYDSVFEKGIAVLKSMI